MAIGRGEKQIFIIIYNISPHVPQVMVKPRLKNIYLFIRRERDFVRGISIVEHVVCPYGAEEFVRKLYIFRFFIIGFRYFSFSALFSSKKDVYVFAVSVCLWANFLANHETHRTKIFSVALSIHMLESIQIWFISDKAFWLNWKKTSKNRAPKAGWWKKRPMRILHPFLVLNTDVGIGFGFQHCIETKESF